MSNFINTWPPLLLSRDGGGDYRGHVVAAAAAAVAVVVVDERARLRREGIVVPVLVAVDLHSQILKIELFLFPNIKNRIIFSLQIN